MGKEKQAEQAEQAEQAVKVRVLVDCEHGKCNEVIEIDSGLVDSLVGVVDADPKSVAYAESLK